LGLKKLTRRIAYRRNKFLRRKFYALRRAKVTGAAVSELAIAGARTVAKKQLVPFVERSMQQPVVSPLTFAMPITFVPQTVEQKKRLVLANIKLKAYRFKRTAQYAETLTHYIPALMNFMLSRRIKNGAKLGQNLMKILIKTTY
jgi:hypothetical protein